MHRDELPWGLGKLPPQPPKPRVVMLPRPLYERFERVYAARGRAQLAHDLANALGWHR